MEESKTPTLDRYVQLLTDNPSMTLKEFRQLTGLKGNSMYYQAKKSVGGLIVNSGDVVETEGQLVDENLVLGDFYYKKPKYRDPWFLLVTLLMVATVGFLVLANYV